MGADFSEHSGDFNPEDLYAGLFDNISAADFDTEQMAALRQRWEEIDADNAAALAEFDPSDAEARSPVILTLDGPLPEHEDLDALNDQYRVSMIQRLGLEFRWLEDGDPALISQYRFPDGSGARQIRRHTRADGRQVNVQIFAGKNETPVSILLLSDAATAGAIRIHEMVVATTEVTTQLAERLGADPEEFARQTGAVPLKDKQAMLAGLNSPEAEEADIALGAQIVKDMQAMEKARGQYTRTVMPALGLLRSVRAHKLAERQKEYADRLTGRLRALEYTPEQTQKALGLEQKLRHEALDKQLSLRVRLRALGTAALVLMSEAAGLAAGEMLDKIHAIPYATPPESIAVGVAGVSIYSIYKIASVRRLLRSLLPFKPLAATESQTLEQQLADEVHCAETNAVLFRHLDS